MKKQYILILILIAGFVIIFPIIKYIIGFTILVGILYMGYKLIQSYLK